MSEKKYELTTNSKLNISGKKLFQIRALITFGIVKAGNLGGWIEKESNLSHDGNAWVYGEYRMMTISNMGSVQRTTTFFVCKDGKIRVSCGCFFGDLDEFRTKVRETHDDSKHAQAYLSAVDFVESVLDTNVKKETE